MITFHYEDIARKQPHRAIFDPLLHLRVKKNISDFIFNYLLQTVYLLVSIHSVLWSLWRFWKLQSEHGTPQTSVSTVRCSSSFWGIMRHSWARWTCNPFGISGCREVSRWLPDQMPEPPEVALFNVKKRRNDSNLLEDVWAPHPPC